jgi:uncharacterized repeat protein (TIGR01451 family)
VYSGDASRLKYDLVVQPGADPSVIRMAYRGSTALQVNAGGQLEVSAGEGGFVEDTPYAYQEVGGQRVQVPASFALGSDGSYGFRVRRHDPTRPLVIDPVVLLYAGYIGGSSVESGNGIAVDTEGNAYVTGLTASTAASFPVTSGPDTSFNGGWDAYVAKVNASGTGLIYAGYIGGAKSFDAGVGVAVDAQGNAYVTGGTSSAESTFPVTVGPDTTPNGGGEAFVAKVNPSGTGLVYAGYIGGSSGDGGRGIAVDAEGGAYVTGWTGSREATFPVTGGPDTTFNGGGVDAFVAKVNPDGTGLLYAGYLGGSENDVGQDLALDAGGNAYVTGWTNSSEATFPATGGPETAFSGGDSDAFVAKVSSAGTGLVYAGYIGGLESDYGEGVALDAGGSAYVTGWTNSSEATFPITGGPDTTFNGGLSDAFVAKVNPSGTGLLYAGYIGGSSRDLGLGVATDAGGNSYVTGLTASTAATFPDTVGPDTSHNGDEDAFVAKVNPTGTGLVYAGYIGGSNSDRGGDIAVDASGSAYVIGETSSTEATFPVTVGPDTTYNGGGDAFVAKISETPGADLSLVKTDSPDPVQVKSVLTYTLDVNNGGPSDATAVTVEDELPPSVQFISATPSQGTCTQAGGVVTCSLGSVASGASATVTIKVRPTSSGTLTNTAEVSAAEADPDPANNADTETTTVNGGKSPPPPGCKFPPCP